MVRWPDPFHPKRSSRWRNHLEIDRYSLHHGMAVPVHSSEGCMKVRQNVGIPSLTERGLCTRSPC